MAARGSPRSVPPSKPIRCPGIARAPGSTAVLLGLLLAVPSALATSASAGNAPAGAHGWVKLAPAAHPGARERAAMAYDRADGYVVLFGGDSVACGGVCNDTWTFHAGTWTRLHVVGPSSRSGAMMSYDAADGYLVLFGGVNGSTTTRYLNDTWKFVHGSWTRLAPAVSPPGRTLAMMAYDGATRRVEMGGGAGGSNLTDMWAFRGGAWSSVPSPAPRGPGNPFHGRFSAMAYDVRDGYLVYYGGQAGFGGNETWVYAAGNWSEINATGSPPVDYGPSLAYDPALHQIVLFGGSSPGTTWTFHGGGWRMLRALVHPGARELPSLCFDTSDGYLLLFGGDSLRSFPTTLGDTWELS